MSLKMFDGNDLPHEYLAKLRNALINNMLTDIKLSKAQISKIIQFGGFLGSLLRSINESSNSFSKKCFRNNNSCFNDWCRNSKENIWFSDNNFNNFKQKKEWHNQIVQALEDSNILLKGVTKTIKNETKEQKGGFLSMLLGTLGASLLGNNLAGKEIVRAGSGNKKRKGIVRAGYGKERYF